MRQRLMFRLVAMITLLKFSRQSSPAGLLRRASSGQSVVEVACIFVVLIPILIGSFDLGRAYFGYSMLTHAVNEGARRGSFDSNSATVITAVQTAGSWLNIQSGHVSVVCYSGSSSTIKTCSTMVLGDTVAITATSNFVPATPWLTRLIPGGSLTLSAAARRTYQ